MNLSNMKIGARLALGFALTIVVQLAMSLTGIGKLEHNAELTEKLVSDRYQKVQMTNDMRSQANRGAQALRNAMLSPDAKASQEFLLAMAAADKSAGDTGDQLEKILRRPEAKKIAAEIQGSWVTYRARRDQVLSQFQGGDRDGAVQALFKDVVPLQSAYFAHLDEMLNFQADLMVSDGQDARDSAKSAALMMIGLLVLATLMSALAGYLITRSVTRPINEAVTLAETVAQGDLTAQVEVKHQDETGRLLLALKEMVNALTRTVGAVRVSTETINTGSAEIAAGNLNLSQRTEQQAASLEETASSMEQLTSTVRQNADNARSANQLVLSAADSATEGGRVVSEVVSTMGAIKESSARIVDIISVIDGIAFQTNILALNAAVEAARAGEQGRGFAVVASEVRNLAQRSANAAKEIKGLIDDSVLKVDAGGRLVDQAGASMQRIVSSVQQVAAIMTEISSASQEQSAGIEQVNIAITEMDHGTQQNAALVEQAAAAARSMQEQTEQLMEAVAVFRLAGNSQRSPAPSRPAMAAPPARPVAVSRTTPALANRSAPAKPQPARAAARATAGNASGDDWEEF
jgi:methyl-accepting chemotaxis protein